MYSICQCRRHHGWVGLAWGELDIITRYIVVPPRLNVVWGIFGVGEKYRYGVLGRDFVVVVAAIAADDGRDGPS